MMEKDDIIHNIYFSEAYLPYHPEAYENRIVRVEGDKEVLLNKWEVISIEDMVAKTIPITEWQGVFWHYDPEIECHIAPGPE